MFAYIPARIGSKRIKKKNIRPLDGKPLIEHVIDNLSKSKMINGISVSTDSSEILEICKAKNITTLGLRDSKLSDNITGFIDLIKYDLPRFCNYFNDKEFIFCLPTAALVSGLDYDNAILKFKKKPNSLVMSVVDYEISPFLAIQKVDKEYLPLFPNEYTKPTNRLKKAFADCGCFYISSYDIAKSVKKLIDIKPLELFQLDRDVGIDLDNEIDWINLEKQYAKIKRSVS